MGWLIGAVLALLVFGLWIKGRLLGALLMYPIALWLFWLAFLPMEPSTFQWIADFCLAAIIVGFPWAVRHMATPPLYS